MTGKTLEMNFVNVYEAKAEAERLEKLADHCVFTCSVTEYVQSKSHMQQDYTLHGLKGTRRSIHVSTNGIVTLSPRADLAAQCEEIKAVAVVAVTPVQYTDESNKMNYDLIATVLCKHY